jgi:hypothetical protein
VSEPVIELGSAPLSAAVETQADQSPVKHLSSRDIMGLFPKTLLFYSSCRLASGHDEMIVPKPRPAVPVRKRALPAPGHSAAEPSAPAVGASKYVPSAADGVSRPHVAEDHAVLRKRPTRAAPARATSLAIHPATKVAPLPNPTVEPEISKAVDMVCVRPQALVCVICCRSPKSLSPRPTHRLPNVCLTLCDQYKLIHPV